MHVLIIGSIVMNSILAVLFIVGAYHMVRAFVRKSRKQPGPDPLPQDSRSELG